MNDQPVSVVVPTRNRRELLQQCLHSVLSQQGVAVQVIVVDEASDDGTAEFLAGLRDERVSVIRHKTAEGLPRARNEGIASATTEWVAMVDDDDLWAPTKLASQLSALGRDPVAAWSCVGGVFVDDRLTVLGQHRLARDADVRRLLLEANVIPGSASSVLVRTEAIRSVGGFREELRWGEDWDLWIRLSSLSPPAVVDRPLMAYRLSSTSMSHDTALVAGTLEALRANFAEEFDRHGIHGESAELLLYLAKQELRAGRRLAAAGRYFDVAVRYRRPVRFLNAAGALVAPGLLRSLGRWRSRRQLDPGWAAEAHAWLAPYRDLTVPG